MSLCHPVHRFLQENLSLGTCWLVHKNSSYKQGPDGRVASSLALGPPFLTPISLIIGQHFPLETASRPSLVLREEFFVFTLTLDKFRDEGQRLTSHAQCHIWSFFSTLHKYL
ncbi:hypothetical protein CEXT_711541 [Caerostris extrusa]|uniref:Uncharacterized protein n=1 Tax=Caerostris extrusa TaxID=172846 RepID=A0AAV4N3C2_CAEEX|nr:hypothetical protein CEXT_711541 [Caerostris extrusa]